MLIATGFGSGTVTTLGNSSFEEVPTDAGRVSPDASPVCGAELVPAGAPIAILGVPFDNVTTAETVALVARMIASRQPHYLVTANVDFLVQAVHDVELRRILFDAHLVLCDGTPLLWASRWLGRPLPERVAGSDLVPLLAQTAAVRGDRLFFLGGSPDATAQAVARLRAQHPGINIVGHYSPPYRALLDLDHDEIRQRIQATKPDLLFVCFGCPKQEKWIAMHYRSLGVPVSIGVGGTIDFLAERLARAPRWMQRTGTEWIFRLLQEPRRLTGRYLRDCWHFGRLMLAQWCRMRFRRRRGGLRATPGLTRQIEGCQELRCPDWLDAESVSHDALFWDRAMADQGHLLLDLRQVRFIDSTGVGLLIRLRKRAALKDRQVVLIAPSPPVRRALESMKLWTFFLTAHEPAAARNLLAARASAPAVPDPNPFAPVPTLSWRGEVTAAVAEEVWEATAAFLRTHGGQGNAVAISLAEVPFIDSTGAGLMVRARKQAVNEHAKLKFLDPRPDVLNVIRLAKLDAYLLGES